MFFTADLHFNHAGILQYCARPFANVDDMNGGLVERWNATVPHRATVYVLGDFGFTNRHGWDLLGIFESLHGHKHLVTGNHDEKNKEVMKLPWESVSPLVTVRHNGRRFVCCHYPLETWKSAARGYLHLHGHSHGTLRRQIPHRFDVGVDALGAGGPMHADALLAAARAQTFEPQDHHGEEEATA